MAELICACVCGDLKRKKEIDVVFSPCLLNDPWNSPLAFRVRDASTYIKINYNL